MKLTDLIDEARIYKQCEDEIREWIESSYPGLSIEFYPNNIEIVRTDEGKDFSPLRVQKITEAVNIKIGDVLESHDEEIVIAERLTRIYKKHPEFKDFDEVNSIEELKRHPQFLKYFKELIIRRV